jgi:hypothetical protein
LINHCNEIVTPCEDLTFGDLHKWADLHNAPLNCREQRPHWGMSNSTYLHISHTLVDSLVAEVLFLLFSIRFWVLGFHFRGQSQGRRHFLDPQNRLAEKGLGKIKKMIININLRKLYLNNISLWDYEEHWHR